MRHESFAAISFGAEVVVEVLVSVLSGFGEGWWWDRLQYVTALSVTVGRGMSADRGPSGHINGELGGIDIVEGWFHGSQSDRYEDELDRARKNGRLC